MTATEAGAYTEEAVPVKLQEEQVSSGSMLPPDLRAQAVPRGGGGIGSAAPQNAQTARQRRVAMGQEEPEAEDAAVEQTTEEERLVKICPNTRCAAEAKDEWNFCAKCGQDLLRTGTAAKKLGISFAEEDIQDYLFKGFVSRELKLLGKHSVLVKSSQAEDLAEIDNYIMNGGWAKDDEGKERRVSDFYMRSMNGLCVTAAAVMKLDGDPIGETLEQRIAYLSGKGSAFVDLLTTRVTLFNRALTEYLQKIDNVLGS